MDTSPAELHLFVQDGEIPRDDCHHALGWDITVVNNTSICCLVNLFSPHMEHHADAATTIFDGQARPCLFTGLLPRFCKAFRPPSSNLLRYDHVS